MPGPHRSGAGLQAATSPPAEWLTWRQERSRRRVRGAVSAGCGYANSATLAPWHSARRLTLEQAPGSLKAALPVVALYCAFFFALALAFPNEPATGEDMAFQLTMPGLEEEPFYRGLLLFTLYRAFTGRVRLLGVDWGWGAPLTCLLFGLAHGFGFSDGHFSTRSSWP